MSIIIKAAKFATFCHEGQKRKYTGKSYITHPTRVAYRTMLLDNVTDDMVAAAFLHDTVEDCNVSLKTLYAEFGIGVEQLVWELTNPSKEKNLPRDEKKEWDRKHLRLVSKEAKQIKLIDRIDNLLEADEAPEGWLTMYLKESKLLLDAIGDGDANLSKELYGTINTIGRRFGMEF